MKSFENAWMLETFEGQRSFFTKRMFGGLAAFLHGRQMLLLVEPTKSGRWKWHGVLICTAHAHHAAIMAEFPELAEYLLEQRPPFDGIQADVSSRTTNSSRLWNAWCSPWHAMTRGLASCRAHRKSARPADQHRGLFRAAASVAGVR